MCMTGRVVPEVVQMVLGRTMSMCMTGRVVTGRTVPEAAKMVPEGTLPIVMTIVKPGYSLETPASLSGIKHLALTSGSIGLCGMVSCSVKGKPRWRAL